MINMTDNLQTMATPRVSIPSFQSHLHLVRHPSSDSMPFPSNYPLLSGVLSKVAPRNKKHKAHVRSKLCVGNPGYPIFLLLALGLAWLGWAFAGFRTPKSQEDRSHISLSLSLLYPHSHYSYFFSSHKFRLFHDGRVQRRFELYHKRTDS